MASKYWIKLYHEVLHDPKMGRLPDNLWRRAIELFLLAGELDAKGNLPCTDEISWYVRQDPEILEDELQKLAKIGILTANDNGSWLVTKFDDRQAAVEDKERMRQYRARKRQQDLRVSVNGTEPKDNEHNGMVTRSVTKSNIDTDTDTEIDSTTTTNAGACENLKLITKRYTSAITVTVSPRMADEFKDYAGQCRDPAWIDYAFDQAEDANVRKWSYVRTILDSCIAAGNIPPKPKKANGRHHDKRRAKNVGSDEQATVRAASITQRERLDQARAAI